MRRDYYLLFVKAIFCIWSHAILFNIVNRLIVQANACRQFLHIWTTLYIITLQSSQNRQTHTQFFNLYKTRQHSKRIVIKSLRHYTQQHFTQIQKYQTIEKSTKLYTTLHNFTRLYNILQNFSKLCKYSRISAHV